MYDTNREETINAQGLSVDIVGLQKLTGAGKKTAERIGREAGAVFYIGKRKLFKVDKVKEYMDKLSEQAPQIEAERKRLAQAARRSKAKKAEEAAQAVTV